MFAGIGRSSVRHPWLTILGWLVAAVALTVFAPQFKSSADQADFLPGHYESLQVADLQERSFPQQERPAATAVFRREDGGVLTAGDKADVVRVTDGLDRAGVELIESVKTSPQAVSPNGKIALASIVSTVDDHQDPELLDAVKELRERVGPLVAGTDLHVGLTGAAASALDTQESSGDTDAMITMATLALIVILLLVIFRSPLIALLPVLIISVVFVVASGLIATAAELVGLTADSSVSSILIVVLFGVGTDYILFLVFRWREQLRAGQEPKAAMEEAVARVGETVASAAGAVIVAFLALLLSSLGMLRAMGPALAISVAVTLVAALTLVPAVFSLLGTRAFWPSKAWRTAPRNELADRTGTVIARRPGTVAAASGAVLAALALGVLSFNPVFDSGSSLPDDLESVRASKEMQRGFAAGQTDPVWVLVEEEDGGTLSTGALTAYAEELRGVEGVGQVAPAVTNASGDVAQIAVVLTHPPTSEQAIELVGGQLRDTAHAAAPEGTRALVGGPTGVLADIQAAVNRDYSLVFPAAGLAIMVILGLLLRSAVAPWFLMLAVALGFGATLGSTVWLFQDLKGESGLLFTLPVIVYLFVVAIGTDYNILMVARLREETRSGVDPREAVHRAVARSAPTIGAAAIILAGTFGVLLLAESTMLQQMGFAVAFGILLTAFVMALLLVPAVTSLLGDRVWWPGERGRRADATVPPPAPDEQSTVGASTDR
ncbi:MMPL family transporter [Streptomyces sp. LE64]|uniref:MMPL family transporter n=1 Tax=Streptomyces sp. LE64 TaxID=3448653 RepID=UPI0040432284